MVRKKREKTSFPSNPSAGLVPAPPQPADSASSQPSGVQELRALSAGSSGKPGAANPGATLGAEVRSVRRRRRRRMLPGGSGAQLWRRRWPPPRAHTLGRAAGMAASLWMGDVSEGGCSGLRRTNLSVTGGRKSLKGRGLRLPEGWK